MTQDKVTLKDVYAIVQRVEDNTNRILEKHDERITAVENKQANSEGKSSVIAFVISTGVSLLGAFIQSHK